MADVFCAIPECNNETLRVLYYPQNRIDPGIKPEWLSRVAVNARMDEFGSEQLTRLHIHKLCYIEAPTECGAFLGEANVTLEGLEKAFAFVVHCIHFDALGAQCKIHARLYNLPSLLKPSSPVEMEPGHLVCAEGLVSAIWPRYDAFLEALPSPCGECFYTSSRLTSDGSCENCGVRKRRQQESAQCKASCCSRMQLRIQDYGMAVREIIVEVSGEVALHEAKKCFQLGEQVRVAGIIDKEVVPLPQPMNKNKNCPGFRLILKVAYMIPFEPVPSLFYGTRCFDQSLRDTFSEKVLATSSTAATAGTAEVARRIKTIFNGHILTSVAASMFPSFRQEQARKIAKALILAVASSSDGSFVGDHLRILLLQESGDSSAWQAMVQGVTTVHPGALPMRCCSSVQLLPSTSNDSHWVRAGELTGISSRDETITRSGEEHLETLLGSAAGVCLLEHIDKLPKPQLNALVSDRPMKPLPGLSVRTFRRCSLLATINVKYGRYDASRKLADNLGPLTKLASSFDLILLSPSVTPQASYVRGSGGKAILDLPEAISYLKYVRDTKSDLPWSEEAEEYFKKRLNQLGEASQNNHMAGVTPPVTSALRKSTLLRMCRGCARIELSDKIDVVHVKQALEIYLVSASMRQDALGISDISEEVAQHESAETRTVRRRGKGKAARRREFLSLCQQEFRRREELTGNELRDLAREAGCELDAECDALIEEANYTGCILKKSGDVYEYCR